MPDDCDTFYWPATSAFAADGTLVMRATGYEGDIRWSGEHRVLPEDPDFALWCSFREAFRASPPLLPFVSSQQMPAIRELWHREQGAVGAPNPALERKPTAGDTGSAGDAHTPQ